MEDLKNASQNLSRRRAAMQELVVGRYSKIQQVFDLALLDRETFYGKIVVGAGEPRSGNR